MYQAVLSKNDNVFEEGKTSVCVAYVTEIADYKRRKNKPRFECTISYDFFNYPTDCDIKGDNAILDYYNQLINQSQDIQSRYTLIRGYKEAITLHNHDLEGIIADTYHTIFGKESKMSSAQRDALSLLWKRH